MERMFGLAWGSPARRSVKRLGPSSSSRTVISAQRSPRMSSARAIPHASPYVRDVLIRLLYPFKDKFQPTSSKSASSGIQSALAPLFPTEGATCMTSTETADRTRWTALYVLCAGVLMIVLDATIVNVALPSIQADLGFSQSNLAWVVNAYLIAFGGLLLLAGRLGDLIGRRRVFLVGLAIFSAA